MKIRLTRTIIALLLTCAAGLALAATGRDTFEDGLTAFRNGDYALAAGHFEAAKAGGMDSAALYYNLGVSYYRLGEYAASEAAFLQAAKFDSIAPLAGYNVGLVRLKLDDRAAARQWFETTLATTTDSKLSTLARYQLDALDVPPPRPAAADNWLSFVTTGIGYDDNVTLDNDTLTAVSTQSDSFAELMAATRGAISGSRSDGIVFKGSLFADVYSDLTQFNLAEGSLGLYKAFTWAGWNSEAGGYLTYSTLGGSGYLQSANIDLATRKHVTSRISLRARLRYRQLSAVDPLYDAIDGSQAIVRLEARCRTASAGSLRAWYQYDDNDRNDITTATTFTSLSPLRQSLYADYSRYIGTHWYFRLGAEYRNSSYPDDNIESTGIAVRRRDDRLRYQLGVERKLGATTDLALEYSYTDNRSNIDRYSYERNMVLASFLLSF